MSKDQKKIAFTIAFCAAGIGFAALVGALNEVAADPTQADPQKSVEAVVMPTLFEYAHLVTIDWDSYLDLYLPLAPDDKSRLWREKIEALIQNAGDVHGWSDQQVELLFEAYDMLTPELFSGADEIDDYLTEIDDWASRALEQFPAEDFDRIVRDLGDYPTVRIDKEQGPTVYCSCHSTGILSCRLGMACVGGGNCHRTESGCGLFGLFPCRGACATPGGPVLPGGSAPVNP